MSFQPLISVIIPISSEKYIDESIQSILNQSYNNLELILVDDCSTDKNKFIIENYSVRDKRIKLINNEKYLGYTRSFNKGLLETNGEYIVITNSSCISLRNRIEKQVDLFQNWSELEVLGSNVIMIGSKGEEINRKKFPPDLRKIKKNILYDSPVFKSSAMIKSNTIKLLGGFDERLYPADHFHLCLNLFKENKVISNINEYLIKYRIDQENLSDLEIQNKLDKSFLARRLYFSNYSTNEYFKKKNYQNKTNFENLVIKYWKKEKTTLVGSNKILKEYFNTIHFKDKANNNIILFIIYSLFVNKRYLLFVFYLTKFLLLKIIK